MPDAIAFQRPINLQVWSGGECRNETPLPVQLVGSLPTPPPLSPYESRRSIRRGRCPIVVVSDTLSGDAFGEKRF